MDKLSKDEIALRKAKKYIDALPDYARRFFNKTKLKPSSIHVYSIEIAAFFDYIGTTSIKLNKISDLEKITPEVLEDYVEYLKSATKNGKKRNSSDRTIHRIICILSAFFDYYFQNGVILYNPASKVFRPVIPSNPKEGSSIQDNLKLLEYVEKGTLPNEHKKNQQKNLRNRDTALLALIIGTGIKISECVDLNIQDVDLEHRFITIKSRNVPNKIYISEFIADKLRIYLEERLELIAYYGHDDALFLSQHKKRLCVRSIEKLMQKYSTTLFDGKYSIKPQDLRNAFRRNVFTESKNIFITSEMCSNSPLTILHRYISYLECYETEKAVAFNPDHMYTEEQNEIQ